MLRKMTAGFRPVLILALAGLTGMGCEAMGYRDTSYKPVIDPANFQAGVDNPYFPLVPGTTLRYVEKEEGKTLDNEVTVTKETKVILGVTCMVVHDTVKEKGVLKEDTYDWYAQDKQGNVWYFGEATKELRPGKVITEGSWEAGVDGAQAGIIMPGKPVIGVERRTEYYHGHAEDMAKVIALNEPATVPSGTYPDCVKTEEWSMLEVGTENKWYARGVGIVREVASSGATSELVEIKRP